ncbi:hypothetical protein PR048_000761 [Dryococelus australis]|uniref:Uncharacterized protein n=1 Tax=Dryococelus australis TaxID=614101 RepID=A0ABQ9IFH7_9NEOP|nr:hypothetical protein PR048_000761 [Dryococelus australis]
MEIDTTAKRIDRTERKFIQEIDYGPVRTEVKPSLASGTPAAHASKMATPASRTSINAWYLTHMPAVQPIRKLPRHAVANHARGPFPEPRAANQRVGTPTSKEPPLYFDSVYLSALWRWQVTPLLSGTVYARGNHNYTSTSDQPWPCSDEPGSIPAGSPVFASGKRAGRCRWSAGFLGDLPFPPPLHSGTALYSLKSPSSALKASLTTTETLHVLRVGAIRHYACVLVSPISLPRFLASEAQYSDFSTPNTLIRFRTGSLRFSHMGKRGRLPFADELSRGAAISPALAFRRCSIVDSLHLHRRSHLASTKPYIIVVDDGKGRRLSLWGDILLCGECEPGVTRTGKFVTLSANLAKPYHNYGRPLILAGAAVAEWLACLPPIKANRVQSPAASLPIFCMWESWWTMPLVGGFYRGSPVTPRAIIQVRFHTHLNHPHRLSRPLTLTVARTVFVLGHISLQAPTLIANGMHVTARRPVKGLALARAEFRVPPGKCKLKTRSSRILNSDVVSSGTTECAKTSGMVSILRLLIPRSQDLVQSVAYGQ